MNLPEVRWTYRRAFSFVALVLAVWLMRQTIARIDDAEALKTIALSLNQTVWVVVVFYLCGPTVTDLAKIIAAIRGGQRSPGEPS